MKTPPIELLKRLDPLSTLADDRLKELASFCHVESIGAELDPFRVHGAAKQSVYIVRGTVEVSYEDGGKETITGGEVAARRPVGKGRTIKTAVTANPVDLLRVDDDLIDIMVTWSQIAELGEIEPAGAPETPKPAADSTGGWMQLSGVFSVDTLTAGAFATLPPAHIAELLKKFEPIHVKRGTEVVREGGEGDYYYIIESGRARVTRMVGGTIMPLADLKSGDAFGEEALISEGRRNATVTMKTDGQLLRLAKTDFDRLLRKPLLSEIDHTEATNRVKQGGQWLDVRFPSEYQHDRIPGAINIPLGELRHALNVLDKNVEYVAYCQSGRRSAAAAFLLAQRGFRAVVLIGGLWSERKSA